ncbi:hypothetical protein FA95DRAFT_1683444 [Auriscalpium vulgare]|uniref:Uncharacterized protein n=1 Tax=Auriscalpium vulgare TaxID=40419 RepID=A0ACB8RAS8_9AGAM|nr:hypothetical protein FA95DRAFT_1683444 [Auriscalpium vulgare]
MSYPYYQQGYGSGQQQPGQSSQLTRPNPGPELYLNGYISNTFSPNGAQYYFACLLKVQSPNLHPTWSPQGWPGAAFITLGNGQTRLLDYYFNPSSGSVIPQRLWFPHSVTDQRQYVAEAQLESPVFFVHENGALGVTLPNALTGNCHSLRGVRHAAPIGGKASTHLRIAWPGYKDWKRQFQTRDETPDRNPITLEKFVRHVGRSVDAFLQQCEGDPMQRANPAYMIGGPTGIRREEITIIGVVHVSAGSWQPIIKLSRIIL